MNLIFDIETDGLYDDVTKLWCISIREATPGSVGKLYYDRGDPQGVVSAVDEREAPPVGSKVPVESSQETVRGGDLADGLRRLSCATQLIGHNIIGYDLPVLRKLCDFSFTGKVTDTLVLSRLFNPDRQGGHSLRSWGERLGFPKGDYDDWTGGLTEEMLWYCNQDTAVTLQLYLALKEEIKGQRWGESIQIEHDVARIIAEQEVNGVLFDQQLGNSTIEKILTRIDKIDSELLPLLPLKADTKGTPIKPYTVTGALTKRAEKIVGEGASPVGIFSAVEYSTVDLNSIHQVKKWLTSIGWQPTEFTPTGGGKLTEDSFDSLSDQEIGSRLRQRVQLKHRLGQIEGWFKVLRADGRISASANTIGTPTGRFRHRQVVNVPAASTYPKGHEKAGQLHFMDDTSLPQRPLCGAEMRSMFCVRDGYKLVGHDASGLELRMLAHYMNDPDYSEVLLNGDIHSYNQKLADLHTREDAKTFI